MASAKKAPARRIIAIPGGGGIARQHQGDQRLLVNPGQVQRLQPQGHGLASQLLRRLQARPRTLLQVSAQRRLIASRQPGQFTSS